MRSWDIREVFVIDHGMLRGVLTDSDIIVMAITSGHSPSKITAGDCYSPNTPRLDADQTLPTALAYMRRHGVDRVAVTERDQLVGGVWLTDLEHAVAPRPQPHTPPPNRMPSP
jgi:CBS domain-containing protein